MKGRRIAIPGTLTTAYLALRLYEPSFEYVVVPFDRIQEAVAAGEADAGLLIHEGQLTYADEGLRKVPIPMEGLVKTEGLLMSEHGFHYVSAFVSAIAITLIAAVYPARRAATYDPVAVIRGAH